MNLVILNSNNIKVEEFLLNFTSKATRKAYARDLYDFFQFITCRNIHINTPSEFQIIHLIAYRDYMTQLNLAPKTVNRKISSIKSLFKWFHLKGLTPHNIASSLKVSKSDTKTPTQAFTDEEVLNMLKIAKNSEEKLLLKILFYLGLRRSEIVNIKKSDIYENRGHKILRILGKGNKTREIPLNEELYQELTKHPSEDLIFKITDYTIYRTVKRVAKRAGITKSVSPHSCRATVISSLLEKNISPRNVADFAGHSSINTTIECYDKKRDGFKNSAAYAVNYGEI